VEDVRDMPKAMIDRSLITHQAHTLAAEQIDLLSKESFDTERDWSLVSVHFNPTTSTA